MNKEQSTIKQLALKREHGLKPCTIFRYGFVQSTDEDGNQVWTNELVWLHGKPNATAEEIKAAAIAELSNPTQEQIDEINAAVDAAITEENK